MINKAGVTDEKMWMFTMATMEKTVHHVKILQRENGTVSMGGSMENEAFKNMLAAAIATEVESQATKPALQSSRNGLKHKRQSSPDRALYLEVDDWTHNGTISPGKLSCRRRFIHIKLHTKIKRKVRE